MRKSRARLSLVALLILAVICLGACTPAPRGNPPPAASQPTVSSPPNATPPTSANPSGQTTGQPKPTATGQPSGELAVHFIDVGQADSILIKTADRAMLIDAGDGADAAAIRQYLQNQRVSRLDYLILTHPHADHIGSAASIIRSMEIGKILMPEVTHTTQAFEDVLVAVRDRAMKITSPTVGIEYELGDGRFTILAPNDSGYEDLNNYSIVLRLTHGQTSFLFMGDAQNASESQMLSNGLLVDSDVIKIGHHGSSSSTTAALLSKVTPSAAVVLCGKGNSYGHPAADTMARLEAGNVYVYRTDESGSIVAISDGKDIRFSTAPGSYKAGAASTPAPGGSTGGATIGSGVVPVPVPPGTDKTVFVTKSGSKYHNEGCRYLSASSIPVKLSDALKQGYTACSVCKP